MALTSAQQRTMDAMFFKHGLLNVKNGIMLCVNSIKAEGRQPQPGEENDSYWETHSDWDGEEEEGPGPERPVKFQEWQQKGMVAMGSDYEESPEFIEEQIIESEAEPLTFSELVEQRRAMISSCRYEITLGKRKKLPPLFIDAARTHRERMKTNLERREWLASVKCRVTSFESAKQSAARDRVARLARNKLEKHGRVTALTALQKQWEVRGLPRKQRLTAEEIEQATKAKRFKNSGEVDKRRKKERENETSAEKEARRELRNQKDRERWLLKKTQKGQLCPEKKQNGRGLNPGSF